MERTAPRSQLAPVPLPRPPSPVPRPPVLKLVLMETAGSGSELAADLRHSTPEESAVYVYSIIESEQPRTFGKIGIGGRGDDVYTVHYKDLAAVVSRTPLMVYDPTRENALAHLHVNEVTMDERFTPVPMSFGTLFKTEKDIVEFLEDTYDAIRDVLGKMKDKLEFGLKVNWSRDEVMADVQQDNEDIRRLKEEIAKNQQSSTYFARMQLGRMLEQALADKSDAYVRDIYEYLREAAIASRSSKPIGDKMILNAAFLVERAKAEIFDQKVQEIAQRYEGKLAFRYTGPWPPYNFVTIRLQLERSAVI
jgi:virulence-associated protein VapD